MGSRRPSLRPVGVSIRRVTTRPSHAHVPVPAGDGSPTHRGPGDASRDPRSITIVGTLAFFAVAGLLLGERTARAAPDPAVVGRWSQVREWPVKAVHAHLLPDGTVMTWPLSDDPYVWDPR